MSEIMSCVFAFFSPMKHKCFTAAVQTTVRSICTVSCLGFQTEDNVICHDKHIIHSSIMHLTSLFSHCWDTEKKKLLLFSHLLILHATLYGKHKRDWTPGKCISPWWNAFAAAGQQWPWEYSEATPELSLFWKWSRPRGLIRGSHAFSPLAQRVKTTSRGNHLTHFHPISTAECVHFQANGMSFCWSLWSRINPGIKTDFPGSNLPSSIDFFTLTEPVLPNLTWQPAAQWTGSTLASHRGSSPPHSLYEVKESLGRKKKRTPRCIKQRALLTENTEIKLLSLCFTSNYVFQYSATWAGTAEREKGECSGPISYHYGPVDIPLSLSDSHLWFPLAIFHRCTKRGFIIAP